MASTILATTASGSTYVISMEADGVRWFRVPGSGSLASAAAGWQASLPRVVLGERLLLGPFQSTPVRDVAFIPGPWVGSRDAALDDGWAPSRPVGGPGAADPVARGRT